MEEYSEDIIRMYSKLRDHLENSERSLAKGSVLFLLLKKGSKNIRRRIMIEAAVDATSISVEARQKLIENGFILKIGGKDKIILTSKGIWHAELHGGICSLDKLLEFVESNWFHLPEDESVQLDDKEKIVLFTLICLRAFSKDACVHIQPEDERYQETLKEIVTQAADFLYNKNIISSEDYQEEVVRIRNYFNRTDKISPKTTGLYVAAGGKYYLNISQAETISENQLKYLFHRVLEEKTTFKLLKDISVFCKEVAYSLSHKVIDESKYIFAQYKYDEAIDIALRELMRS